MNNSPDEITASTPSNVLNIISNRNQKDCMVSNGSRLISNKRSVEAISLSLPDNAYDLSSNFTRLCKVLSLGVFCVPKKLHDHILKQWRRS